MTHDLNQLTPDDVFRLIADPSWTDYRASHDRAANALADRFMERIREAQDAEEDDPEFPELEFDCAMRRDGSCPLVGTEDCDFECPERA